MITTKYPKNKLNTKIERLCFNCKGTGVIKYKKSKEKCFICNGQGQIDVVLELCPACNDVVPADNKIYQNGQKVCFDCYKN